MDEHEEPVLEQDRRTFIKQGLMGTLLFGFSENVLTGCAPAAHLTKKFESVKRFTLSPGELAVLESVAEALILVKDDGGPTATEIGVASLVDEMISWRDDYIQDEFKQLLSIMDSGILGLFFNGIPRGITNCSDEEKQEVLQSWSTSSLAIRRKGFMAVKRLCMVAYWTDERTWKYCGYEGPVGFLKYKTIRPGVTTNDDIPAPNPEAGGVVQ